MISATTSHYMIDRKEGSLFDIFLHTANAIAKCVTDESRDPEIPGLLQSCAVDVTARRVFAAANGLQNDTGVAFATPVRGGK